MTCQSYPVNSHADAALPLLHKLCIPCGEYAKIALVNPDLTNDEIHRIRVEKVMRENPGLSKEGILDIITSPTEANFDNFESSVSPSASPHSSVQSPPQRRRRKGLKQWQKWR